MGHVATKTPPVDLRKNVAICDAGDQSTIHPSTITDDETSNIAEVLQATLGNSSDVLEIPELPASDRTWTGRNLTTTETDCETWPCDEEHIDLLCEMQRLFR